MNELIEKAKKAQVSVKRTAFTDMQLELAVAAIKGEVIVKGVMQAMGFKSQGHTVNWLFSATKEAYRQGLIK